MSRLMERRGMVERAAWLSVQFAGLVGRGHRHTARDRGDLSVGMLSAALWSGADRRTDYLEQRQVVMARWAKHVTGQNG